MCVCVYMCLCVCVCVLMCVYFYISDKRESAVPCDKGQRQTLYLGLQVGQAAVDGGERASLESEVQFVGLSRHPRSLTEHAIQPGGGRRKGQVTNKGTREQ